MESGQFEKRISDSGSFGWLAVGAGVRVLSAVPLTLPQPATTDEARASDPAQHGSAYRRGRSRDHRAAARGRAPGLRAHRRGGRAGEDLADLTGLPGARIRWADLDAGAGRVVELLEYVAPIADPVAGTPNAPGVAHVGIAVPDLAAALERLAAAGVPIRSARPVRLHGGDWDDVQCLYAADPDGLTVELLERPAG